MISWNNVGRIVKGTYFVKHLNACHFMKKFQGFGCSVKILHELKTLNIPFIVHIYEKANGSKEYRLAKVDDFLKSDKEWVNEAPWGKDPQRFISVKDMKVIAWDVLV